MTEKESVCAVYEWRMNYEKAPKADIETWLTANAKKWVFTGEEGTETGYKHWQGRFSLMGKKTLSSLKKYMSTTFPNGIPNYLKPTVNANHQQKQAFYHLKADTRIEGPYQDKNEVDTEEFFMPSYLIPMLDTIRPWQQYIFDSGEKPYTRKINLVYDTVGNKGKSVVASLGELLHKHIDIPPLNDYEKIIALLCNICIDDNIRTPKVVYLDLPRAVDKSKLYGMYSAIEQLKKGKLYDTRHHYRKFWINPPAVWVFCNELPDTNYLSIDRWDFWTIDPQTQQLCSYDILNKTAFTIDPAFIDEDKERILYSYS